MSAVSLHAVCSAVLSRVTREAGFAMNGVKKACLCFVVSPEGARAADLLCYLHVLRQQK